MEFKTNIDYRKDRLKLLLSTLIKYENEITLALYNDFKKSEFESVITETSYVISDLKHTIKNINKWAKPKKVLPSLLNFPSSDYILSEPYGKVLVISPWNFPFAIMLGTTVAAVVTGNTVIDALYQSIKLLEITNNETINYLKSSIDFSKKIEARNMKRSSKN